MRLRGLALVLATAGALAASAPSEEAPAAFHEVQPGETLWRIAADRIGDPFLWPALYRANRDQIKNPSLVYPGQRLAIPHLDAAAREALRRESGLEPPP